MSTKHPKQKRQSAAAQTWHIVDEGHEQGEVPGCRAEEDISGREQGKVHVEQQRTTCQGVLVSIDLCRQRAAWHAPLAKRRWKLPKCSCMELGRQVCSKGAGYDAMRRRAACGVLATSNKILTLGVADTHHIHRGVLTMKTVASVYSI